MSSSISGRIGDDFGDSRGGTSFIYPRTTSKGPIVLAMFCPSHSYHPIHPFFMVFFHICAENHGNVVPCMEKAIIPFPFFPFEPVADVFFNLILLGSLSFSGNVNPDAATKLPRFGITDPVALETFQVSRAVDSVLFGATYLRPSYRWRPCLQCRLYLGAS